MKYESILVFFFTFIPYNLTFVSHNIYAQLLQEANSFLMSLLLTHTERTNRKSNLQSPLHSEELTNADPLLLELRGYPRAGQLQTRPSSQHHALRSALLGRERYKRYIHSSTPYIDR